MTGHIKKKQVFCDVDADIKGSSCLPYHTATLLLFKMQLILRMEDDKNEGGRGEGQCLRHFPERGKRNVGTKRDKVIKFQDDGVGQEDK